MVFFILVDRHFVALGPICIGFSFAYFLLTVYFRFFFKLSCAFICLILLMDGCSSLIFYIQGFSSDLVETQPKVKGILTILECLLHILLVVSH